MKSGTGALVLAVFLAQAVIAPAEAAPATASGAVCQPLHAELRQRRLEIVQYLAQIHALRVRPLRDAPVRLPPPRMASRPRTRNQAIALSRAMITYPDSYPGALRSDDTRRAIAGLERRLNEVQRRAGAAGIALSKAACR